MKHLKPAGSVLEAQPVEPPIQFGESGVHRADICNFLRRPQALGNRGGSRPHSGIEDLGRHPFRPHARLAAEDAALLLGAQRCRGSAHRIDGIVPRSRPHQVNVVTKGEQAAVALLRRRGQRFLAAPGMNDDGLGQIRMQYLIPPNHQLVVLRQDLL